MRYGLDTHTLCSIEEREDVCEGGVWQCVDGWMLCESLLLYVLECVVCSDAMVWRICWKFASDVEYMCDVWFEHCCHRDVMLQCVGVVCTRLL